MNNAYVIYDVNENYAKRLMNAMHQVMQNKGAKRFSCQLFTDEQQLKNYLAENTPEVLITSEASCCSSVTEQYTGKKVILTEDYLEPEVVARLYGPLAVGIYRYQTADKILKQMMERCPIQHNTGLGKTEIIGVYTPVCSEQKTSFVLNMAKVLSERYQTLYLNFEEFSGLDELLENASDTTLSDALYYYRQGNQTAEQKISETINQVSGIDYIAPVRCAEDITFMDSEQMIHFIETAGKCKDYEVILMDISHAVKHPWKIIECCDCLYMPIKDDYLSKHVLQDFETYFIGMGLESLLENIIKIRLPEGESQITQSFWEKMQYGGMYRFVKTLLDQQKGNV